MSDEAREPMTVADLIKWLSAINPDQEVYAWSKASACEKIFVPSRDIDMDKKRNRVIIDVA